MFNPSLWAVLALLNVAMGFMNLFVFYDIPTVWLNAIAAIFCAIASIYCSFNRSDDDDDDIDGAWA